MTGFVLTASACSGRGCWCTPAGTGGAWLYVALAVAGGGMAGAFGALMARVLSRVPVALAADASGVVVTVNQLGIVVGIATFGIAVPEPGRAAARRGGLGGARRRRRHAAFALSSGHAYLAVSIALAALAVVGVVLALVHVRASRVSVAVQLARFSRAGPRRAGHGALGRRAGSRLRNHEQDASA